MLKIENYSEFKYFKTDYKFRNDKAESDYFDNILIEDGAMTYTNALVSSVKEDMHVAFSWGETLYYASIVFLALSVLSVLSFHNLLITGILLGLSLFGGFMKWRAKRVYKDLGLGMSLTESLFSMDDYSVLREERLKMIEELEKEKE